MPVVVLTGHQDETAAQRALSCGAQDYLLKEDINAALLMRSMRFAVERKRAQLLWRQAMHTDRLKALGRLAAGVAHEVNNPAAYLRANLEMMQQDIGKLRECCERIGAETDSKKDFDQAHALLSDLDEMIGDNLEGVDRISAIVSEMGVFARLKAGETEPVDVVEVIHGTLKLMRNELRHRVALDVTLEPVPTLSAHRNELGQVITNLLLNAADALEEMPREERRIAVRTRKDGDEVVIEIEDNGPGVSQAVRERIFDPFFTTKPAGKGTGLGLSVCTQIIEAHDGRIELSSTSGKGTLVCVRLPLTRS